MTNCSFCSNCDPFALSQPLYGRSESDSVYKIDAKQAVKRILWLILLLVAAVRPAFSVELKISRAALQRTLQQQLFGGVSGRVYLKGSPQTPCYVYAQDPEIRFEGGRIVVRMKTHARVGTSLRGACLGVSLSPISEVSLAPDGEGETLGFRDARLDRISDQKELNFILSPFLSRTVPASMRVNAADLLRKALADSTATSGYKVSLEKLKIHSVQIVADDVIIDADGDLSVK
jgi:hypothetical protein